MKTITELTDEALKGCRNKIRRSYYFLQCGDEGENKSLYCSNCRKSFRTFISALELELGFYDSLGLKDLYKQATQERSHYYVGSILSRILERAEELSTCIQRLQGELK